MLTHAREIQNEVKQKREKIFEFFGLKKKKFDACSCLNISSHFCCFCKKNNISRVVVLLRVRGAPFSRAEEERTWTGEQCDTRRAHTRV